MPKILASTKHFKLAHAMRQQIRHMRPGDPLPTLVELKTTFNVSQVTVERALERLRREGLIVRPDGQQRPVVADGSDPALYRVAIIRPEFPSPTFEELGRVIGTAAREKDWALETIYYRSLDSVNIRRDVGDNDAAIILPSTEPFPASLSASLRRPSRPIVIVQDPPPELRISSVRIDDYQIGCKAVEYLASLGHRRILLFLSEPMAPSGEQRSLAWREQMVAMGETNLEELIVDSQLQPFTYSIVGSYEYFTKWLDEPHPEFTAIFCACCTGAIAVMRALNEHGIDVPGQVSVISHGGESYMGPFLNPALTAVETDIPAYGRKIVEVMEQQLIDPHSPMQHIAVQSSLVVRKSTAPAAATTIR